MFKELMHALVGHPAMNMSPLAGQNTVGTTMSTGQITATMQNSILRQEPSIRRSASRKIFSGNIEVSQVANGYVVNIATREGYEYETHIAQTITEVNEIIAAAMVAFQLEK